MVLKDKKIAILGLGIENYALIKYLVKKNIKCNITICESHNKSELFDKYDDLKKITKHISWRLGKSHYKNLSDFDLIFRSPGSFILKDKKIKLGKAIATSSINLFFDLCASKKIIGVTGTKGKGTTATIIYEILKTEKKTWLGGNIGVAPFEFIEKIKKTDWVVLELSSFQLEDIISSPHIGVITNFTKEHLAPADPNNPNYHKTMREYWTAKLNIAKFQNKSDYLIINKKLKLGRRFKSKLIYFDKSNLQSQLPGEHNKENIAAAAAVAKIAGIKQSNIKKAVAEFKGLEHRLQMIKDFQGVKYYNDSFATTPESAITALQSFKKPIVLIAGGADKNSDFKALAKVIKKRVKYVALLKGKATPKLKRALVQTGYDKNNIDVFKNIKSAVKMSYKQAKINEVVLLSTACASFGMFKNYKERGKQFTEEVNKLK
ncbi:MAG: UDP-N-acetylmuramoyl-L-alanine--D-glutamate ligase [bacterium]